MTHAALVELGSGCCHYNNSTKAAIRACNAAVEWNSVKVRTIIPGSYDAMRLHVQIAVPDPDNVDLNAVAGCFPYGTLLPIAVEKGGMLGSSRTGLPADEPVEALMTVACACVTIGWGDPNEAAFDRAVDEVVDRAADQKIAEGDEALAPIIWPKPLPVPPPPPAPAAPPPAAPPPASPPAPVSTPTAPPTAPVAADRAGLGVTPTVEEMTPKSAEMQFRAKAAAARWEERMITPYEAFKLLGDEDDIEIYDVRTAEQREGHVINGQIGVSVMGALSLPLDDLVTGKKPLPPTDQAMILVCSRGPKSLVALDYLAESCPRAVCIEGGIEAWDVAKLPTEAVGRKAVVEWAAEMARKAREARKTGEE